MKRLLIIVLVLLLAVGNVGATTSPIKETFQDPSVFPVTGEIRNIYMGDFFFYLQNVGSGPGVFSYNSVGNTYVRTGVIAVGSTNYIKAYAGTQVNYIAFTSYGADSTHQCRGVANTAGSVSTTTSPARLEIKYAGGSYYAYVNDVQVGTGAAATNPSELQLYRTPSGNTCFADDIVMGYENDATVIGVIPQTYFINYDSTNPAATGLYRLNTTPGGNPILVDSNYFGASYGRGIPDSTTLQLIDPVGTVVKSYPVANMSCQCTLPISDLMVGGVIRNGLWRISLADSSETGYMFVLGTGASGAWSQEQYASDATAAYTYTVTGTSWDPVTYTYRFDMFDVYGNVVYTSPITTQTGTKTIALDETTYPSGAYYGAVIRTSGSEDTWMTSDLMEIVGYVFYEGYVNDAESATPITGANVSIAQGDIVYNALTPASGEYATNSTFYSGIATIFNITAAGYYQYNATFTPASAGTKTLNFTLQSKTPTFTGIALGGTCRDSVYGRPINYCAVTVTNATYGESYSVVANNAGYYLLDESDGAHLTNGRWYSVAASKTGFSNSVTYLKSVWGA